MKYLKYKLIIILISFASLVNAVDFKIGFIDKNKIFTESKFAKDIQTKLEKDFLKREKEINDLAKQLQTEVANFERNNSTMTASKRTESQRNLVNKERDLNRKKTDFQEDLNQRKNEELQSLIRKANEAIFKIAEDEKYDLIIQEAVYISPKHNVTDKVLKILNSSNN